MNVRALLLPMILLAFATSAAGDAPRRDRPATVDEFMRPGQGPRVIAHRGFSGKAPENTLVAVRRAIELGADMVEIDVGLTRDGHVVVLHDETLDRTTDGEGLLSEATLEEVRKLDAGSWFAPEFAGEKVPTLAEVLDLVRGRILMNVEIKGEAVSDETAAGIADKVLQLVRARDMEDEIVISSFEPEALRQMRELDAHVMTASLYNKELHNKMGPVEVMDAVGSNGFNLSQRRVNRKIVRACHEAGRPVAVYTVNKKAKMRCLIAIGVDALFTDRPDLMLQVLAESSR